MKKIIAIMAVALISVVSVFAFSVGDIKGTWQDENWDANWTFSADADGTGHIVLTKASTGETVYSFTDNNITDFKINTDDKGVSISFTCKETDRSYKFGKTLGDLNTDLDMYINPDWTDEDYKVTLKLHI